MAKQVELVLDNVNKGFAKVDEDIVIQALSNINFTMESGEFVSIVGPSGCGKSTILRLIAGLMPPTTGSITINGERVKGPSDEVGMVFQDPTLFPWLTVEENVGFGLKMDGTESQKKDKIHEIIEMIGLKDFKKDYPNQLSGGMAQRVSLARSLIKEPSILLLDEPLGALDAFTRMNMQNEILSIWEDTKQLLIMVTHDIEEAIYMSGRILVMNKNPGRISHEVEVDLPYPRDRASDEFVDIRNDILNKLNVDGTIE